MDRKDLIPNHDSNIRVKQCEKCAYNLEAQWIEKTRAIQSLTTQIRKARTDISETQTSLKNKTSSREPSFSQNQSSPDDLNHNVNQEHNEQANHQANHQTILLTCPECGHTGEPLSFQSHHVAILGTSHARLLIFLSSFSLTSSSIAWFYLNNWLNQSANSSQTFINLAQIIWGCGIFIGLVLIFLCAKRYTQQFEILVLKHTRKPIHHQSLMILNFVAHLIYVLICSTILLGLFIGISMLILFLIKP